MVSALFWARCAWVGLAASAWAAACTPPDVAGDAAFAQCGNDKCEAGETAQACPSDCSACKSKPNCDDGNPCTADSCETVQGCVHLAQDGGSCLASGPCHEAATCQAGVCVSKAKLWTWSTALQPPGDESVTAVVRDDQGELMAVGNVWRDGVAGKHRDNFLLRVPANGPLALAPPQTNWIQTDPSRDDDVASMAPLQGGGVFAVGARSELTGQLGQPVKMWAKWMVIRPPTDSADQKHLTIAGNHSLASVARAGDGTLLAVGALEHQALLMRFFADGEPSWKLARDAGQGDARLRAVTALPGIAPAWVAVGQTLTPTGLAGWAVRMAGPGTETTWQQTVPAGPGWVGTLLTVAAAPDGGVLAAGIADKTPFLDLPQMPTARLWLLHLDPAGQLLWSRRAEQHRLPVAVLATPGAYPWMVVAGGQAAAALVVLNAAGDELSATPPVGHTVNAATLWPDGTVALGGAVVVNGLGDVWLGRLDRWGNATCAASGSCLAKPDLNCGDGNTCTADGCASTGACSHIPQLSAATCGNGGTCKDSVCVAP